MATPAPAVVIDPIRYLSILEGQKRDHQRKIARLKALMQSSGSKVNEELMIILNQVEVITNSTNVYDSDLLVLTLAARRCAAVMGGMLQASR